MPTAKGLKRGGSRPVHRPKAGPKFRTLADVARHMAKIDPETADFPDREQPVGEQKRRLKC